MAASLSPAPVRAIEYLALSQIVESPTNPRKTWGSLEDLEDVHPLEEAEGYERLHKEYGLPVEEIAAKVGKSKASVYGRLKLCALSPAARKAAEGKAMRHRFHALCPYFAMFPESFAELWVDRLTRKGDTVLDPFCGRGTLPFQALLMGRNAVGADINEVAYCVTRAKTNAPTLAALKRRLTQLERDFETEGFEAERRHLPEFFHVAYRPATLRQVLFLRGALKWRNSEVDCMLAALTLGVLHGESERSPSFLSNQMPHTISTKPDYSVRFWRERDLHAPRRDAFELLRTQAQYRYKSERPDRTATIHHTDMRELPRLGLPKGIKCVVTSPPYFDVTSYQEDQWLRLWFLGGPSKPFATRTEERTSDVDRYWRLIGDMWRMLGLVLARRAQVVIRIGAVRYAPEALAKQLLGAAALSKRKVTLVGQWVSELRKRQTDSFRPGSKGCSVEVDCHFQVQ